MSTFTYKPDFGATGDSSVTTRVAKLGDGYEQRQNFGINPIKESWSLKFSMREDAEANAILGFFETAKAVDSFDWTPPYGVAGKFLCRTWSYSIEVAGRKSISAAFDRVYEP